MPTLKPLLALKVPDAATAGRVFSELDRLKITDAGIARVSHSQLESLRREVKILAIKAAKDKADYLLAAIGERVGRPLVVEEQEVRPAFGLRSAESNTISLKYTGKYKSADGATDDSLQFQKVKVQSTILVKFAK